MANKIEDYLSLMEGAPTLSDFTAALSSNRFYLIRPLAANKAVTDSQLSEVISAALKLRKRFEIERIFIQAGLNPNFGSKSKEALKQALTLLSGIYFDEVGIYSIYRINKKDFKRDASESYVETLLLLGSLGQILALHSLQIATDEELAAAISSGDKDSVRDVYDKVFKGMSPSAPILKAFLPYQDYNSETILTEKHQELLVDLLSKQTGMTEMPLEWRKRAFL